MWLCIIIITKWWQCNYHVIIICIQFFLLNMHTLISINTFIGYNFNHINYILNQLIRFCVGTKTTQIHDKTKVTKYLLDIPSKKKVSIRHNSKLCTIKIASIECNLYFMQKCFTKIASYKFFNKRSVLRTLEP